MAKQSAFASMKSSRGSQLEKARSELEKLNSPAREADARYWTPTVDKAGNGFAVLRFLAAPVGEEVPFVRIFSHAFKGPTGQWYIENSLTSLGQDDPVSEHNRDLWATGTDENQKTVRIRKRKLSFISNVLVVGDKSNPEAEGKVFLFKYGKKIWDKISDAMNGIEEENVAGFNPFDLWDGANFKLRIRTVEGFRNYDKSEFDKQASVATDDGDIETIWKQAYPLLPEVAADKFKTYDELKTKFEKVINARPSAPRGPETPAPKQAGTPPTPQREEAAGDGLGGDNADDAELARFRQLANDE